MKIVADQNIPLVKELFHSFGSIVFLPGRTIAASDVIDADILLVRSITSVNRALLENSRVTFVGSCTIGVDHIDTKFLEEQGIVWANAPGCNANAVIQYVFSAMAALKPQWRQKTIGIIGAGNIGGRLYRRLKKLGVSCCVYDPFLTGADIADLTTLNTVLDADIISCHTPLTKTGSFPSYHLLAEKELTQLRDDVLLINSGRGAVIDNNALLAELARRQLSVALDVWENEPSINQDLLAQVALGTPHIAGYSLEGKEQGSFMIYQALCEYLQCSSNPSVSALLNHDTDVLVLPDVELSDDEQLNQLLLAAYDIARDDHNFRNALLNAQGPRSIFDDLRKNYLSRREYTYYTLPPQLSIDSVYTAYQIIAGTDQT